MANPAPHPPQRSEQPPRVINEYKRFLSEPDLLIKLPAEKPADESAKTREFEIPADDDEDHPSGN